ncbi:hypothetical protein FRC00_014495, partial [Tulasnella sp. 408]
MSTEAADAPASSQKGGPWIPLESNPDLLTMVPQPVKALLLIYPINADLEKRRKEDDEKLKQEGVSPSTDTS